MLDQSALSRCLEKVNDGFGVDRLLSLQNDRASIVRYYTQSRFGYRLFHNRLGSMHMAVGKRGRASDDNYQALTAVEIAGRREVTRILELGCGTGFNTAVIAGHLPSARCVGVDLTPVNLTTARRRSRHGRPCYVRADFHELPFEAQTFDLALAIEAFCHSTDTDRMFGELARVIQPGADILVFDGFRSEHWEGMPSDLQIAGQLVEKAMCVSEFAKGSSWTDTARKHDLDAVATEDLSVLIEADLAKMQRLARVYFKYPPLSRTIKRLLPTALVLNAVAGLLMPFTIRSGFHRYRMVTLRARPR